LIKEEFLIFKIKNVKSSFYNIALQNFAHLFNGRKHSKYVSMGNLGDEKIREKMYGEGG
jgi:hypothetical protein